MCCPRAKQPSTPQSHPLVRVLTTTSIKVLSEHCRPPYLFGTSMPNSCVFSRSAIVESGRRARASVSELRERSVGINDVAALTRFTSVVGKTRLVAVSTVTVINTPRVQSWTERTELRLFESQAVVQMRAERDTDDVTNLCSFRKASAARSPMMTQGAMVLPVVTRGMIEPSATRRFSIP